MAERGRNLAELRKLGVIGAMQEEIALIRSMMQEERAVRQAGIEFVEGRLHGMPIVLAKCGVGKVNAAVCTQLLIDKHGIDAVVFTGVAGALDPALSIGDIVVSDDCLQHDMDVRALGFAPGEIPYAETSVFVADRELADLAEKAAKEQSNGSVVRGRVLSGDQFVSDRAKVRELHETFQGTCTEMEGAAVGQTCELNRMPFVILRSMSDKADGSAPGNFAEFTQMAAERSGAIVAAIAEGLKQAQGK